ncbi:11830_t:CDS:2, partial [Gigaspora rosea]
MFHHAAGLNTRQKESIDRALVEWALIHQSYNYSVECLKTLLATEIVTCGLTCDFWTARSKSGYMCNVQRRP